MMDRLKSMKEQLVGCVEKELYNLSAANTEELGEAIDMIKDLEEAIYYATITKAMEEKEEKEQHSRYYNDNYPKMYRYDNDQMYYDPYRDIDRDTGRMYYNGNGSMNRGGNTSGRGGRSSYYDREYMLPVDLRDDREGRSHMTRKSYMEGKEMHHGKEKQMKELEKYMQELTADMTEMIAHTSPEEKQFLQKKIATLAEKVGQVSV